MQTAAGEKQQIESKKTYIYKLNFSCLADTIEEADACFAKEAQLSFQKTKPAHLCPLVSVVIIDAPKEGYGKSEIKRSE